MRKYLTYTGHNVNSSNLVNYSRDGDQFHYLWAARRCLRLLSPKSGLVAVSIEGISAADKGSQKTAKSGENVIDVAEYYDGEELKFASLVVYCQLKHSTTQLSKPWPLGDLKNTLSGFAEKFSSVIESIGKKEAMERVRFRFVTNRPISKRVKNVVAYAIGAVDKVIESDFENLKKHTQLSNSDLKLFCKCLSLEDDHEGFWEQRNILSFDVRGYLADSDADGPIQLKELVTRKATSEGLKNPTIRKEDVLRALNTDESQLYPAEMMIERLESPVPRVQERDVTDRIISASGTPVIVHAESGVGKSILASRLPDLLPDGSKCVVYDCFGNGQYRSPSRYRHRHRDALVQIANELSGFGLCHPLIPTTYADSSAYLKAFIFRLHQCITVLRAVKKEALLCLVIDAADNAQMAAEEIGESRSFARDLLREDLPSGIRLVMLCRTHRIKKLNPPPETISLPLQSFSEGETARHLRTKFPAATDHDVAEFHRLSSQNPRVQATALSMDIDLQGVLRELGPNPTSVDDTLNKLLESAIKSVKDEAAETEKADIDLICQGLSVLRPLIPIQVIATMSGVSATAIKSFILDIGRPLTLLGENIQFFDEPAETWFREQFRPTDQQFADFVDSLAPLSDNNAYVAATLPQLMLEAGQFDELVELALSSERLPASSPIERRNVELHRLQFALKASLRSNSFECAAKIALKAGGEAAGNSRQENLFQSNTDLVAALVSSDRIEEIVSRRPFSGGWFGCHHVYEAGLMSGSPDLHSDARSRMRMAADWLGNWSRLSSDEKDNERIEFPDIAELALAHLNVHGPDSCARDLRGWRPADVSYKAGRLLARRLVDHARYIDLDALATSRRCDLGLLLAIIVELAVVFRHPPSSAVARALKLVGSSRVALKNRNTFESEDTVIEAVTTLAEVSKRLSVADDNFIASTLRKYLPEQPPNSITSRYSSIGSQLIYAYALHGELVGTPAKARDLASPEIREHLESAGNQYRPRDVVEFNETVGRLLPWLRLRATVALNKPDTSTISAEISNSAKRSAAAARMTHWDQRRQTNQVASTWFEILVLAGELEGSCYDEFEDWIDNLGTPLFINTYSRFSRVFARLTGYQDSAIKHAKQSYSIAKEERSDASSKVDSYIELSRALLPISKPDAAAYFDDAVEVASRIGDENNDRWTALLDLSDAARSPGEGYPEIAYRLSRCAELTYEYVVRDKHFDWSSTIRAIAGLSAPSVFSIMSRWRDRGFGWSSRLLPTAIDYLLDQKAVDPLLAVALLGFRARWNYPKLLDAALGATEDRDFHEELVDRVIRFMDLEGQGAGTWEDVKSVLDTHKYSRDLVNNRIEYGRRERDATTQEDERIGIDREQGDAKDWATIFEDTDTSEPNDLTRAYKRFRDGEPPFYGKNFYREAIRRVEFGNEPHFLAAISEMPSFGLYDLRDLLEVIPNSWKERSAVKNSFAEATRIICRRYCTDVKISRYYQTIPSSEACLEIGTSHNELVSETLQAIAETSELLDAGDFFSLIGLMVVLLSPSEALAALEYGITLVEPDLEDKDGDGPWSSYLQPPDFVDEAVAGYVWAALSSPSGSLRWEGAHVVNAVVSMRRQDVLNSLRSLFEAGNGGTFVDRQFFFYELHAKQWFLIGLARGVIDAPDMGAMFNDLLLKLTDPSQRHVVMRSFAAATLLSLSAKSIISLTTRQKARLAAINAPSQPPIEMSPYDHRITKKRRSKPIDRSDRRFMFGYDTSRYIFQRLGTPFAISEQQIEELAEEVIRDDWSLDEDGSWERDERMNRRMFEDSLSHHSQGTYPKADNLNFYLSYHSMIEVAGKLLETMPLYRDPDYEEDEFQSWFASHTLTRKDGKWLADRRDTNPLNWPEWKAIGGDDSEWPWIVQKEDFEKHAGMHEERLVVWGDWESNSGQRQELVRVASALVSQQDSVSLLHALQTASNPHDYKVPSHRDDLEIDQYGLQLKGWVEPEGYARGLDDVDPWAAGINYPPLQPAEFVCEALDLVSDSECRDWSERESDNNRICLSSRCWSYHDRDENDSSGERGQQLTATRAFCESLMTKTDMDLIVEVQIERRIRRRSHEPYDKDDLGYVYSYTKLFLHRQDGNVISI